MNAWGYYFHDDGEVYSETMENYIDLEYYPLDGLDDYKKTAIPFSKYLNGEIDLELLIQSYTYLLAKNRAKLLKPSSFTKEAMKLVGIEDDNENI